MRWTPGLPRQLERKTQAPRSQEPAGKFADLMYDPGMKSDERVEEKAKFKYEEGVEDVRDIARLAAQYFAADHCLRGYGH